MVGKDVAASSPDISDMASMTSVAPLLASIANEAAKITGPTRIRRILTMALLKFTTLGRTHGDRWELALLGPIVAKNGELVSKTIKKEAKQFSDAKYTKKSTRLMG